MSQMPDPRPDIASLATGAALRRWYWRKTELVDHARSLGLKTSGAKFTILDRIAHYLDTGETDLPAASRPKVTSQFDWHSADLGPQTVITDSYRNTQNVRRFFKAQVGEGFKFNIEFMAWMKSNVGATLEQACEAYRAMRAREAQPGFQSEIATHNQYNQFTRDYMDAVPDATLQEVRAAWSIKVGKPSTDGRHRFSLEDRLPQDQ